MKAIMSKGVYMNNEKLIVIKDEKGRIIRKPVMDWLSYNTYLGYCKLFYDDNDNVIEMQQYDFNDKLQETTYNTYNEYNKLIKSKKQYKSEYIDIDISYVEKYTYDEKQRLISIQKFPPQEKEVDIPKLAEEVGEQVSLDDVSDFDEEMQEENIEIPFDFDNLLFEADFVKYEYDENDNCIKTSCFVKDKLTAVLETQYENNKKKVKYAKNSKNEIQETTKYEHISDFEIIVTKYSSNNEILYTIHKYYDDNKNLVKTLEKCDDETIQTTFKTVDEWIENVHKDNSGNLKKYVVNHYDENGVLTSVEIKGENEIICTSKNQNLFNNPCILNYNHYNTRLKLAFCFGFPGLLLMSLLGLSIVPRLLDISIIHSVIILLFCLFFVCMIPFGLVNLLRHKDLFLKYDLDIANQQIVLYNAIISPYDYFPSHLIPQDLEPEYFITARTARYNEYQFVPIIVNLNAIDTVKFVKSKGNYYADKLVLILNQTTICYLPTNTKILNTLDKLVPIKNKGLLSKFFINNLGSRDNLLG